jgi:hypothetical protein
VESVLRALAVRVSAPLAKSRLPPASGQSEKVSHVVLLLPPLATGVCASASRFAESQSVPSASSTRRLNECVLLWLITPTPVAWSVSAVAVIAPAVVAATMVAPLSEAEENANSAVAAAAAAVGGGEGEGGGGEGGGGEGEGGGGEGGGGEGEGGGGEGGGGEGEGGGGEGGGETAASVHRLDWRLAPERNDQEVAPAYHLQLWLDVCW